MLTRNNPWDCSGFYQVSWSLRNRLEGDDDNYIYLHRCLIPLSARMKACLKIDKGLFQDCLHNWHDDDDGDAIKWSYQCFVHRNGQKVGESSHYAYIDDPASSSQRIGEVGGRTMVSMVVIADDLCCDDAYDCDDGDCSAWQWQFCWWQLCCFGG